MRGRGFSYRAIGRRFGISHTMARKICVGRVGPQSGNRAINFGRKELNSSSALNPYSWNRWKNSRLPYCGDYARAGKPKPAPWERPLADWRVALASYGVRRVSRREIASACPLCGGRDRLHIRETAGGRVIGGCRQCTDGKPDGRRRWYRIAVELFGRAETARPWPRPRPKPAPAPVKPLGGVPPIAWRDNGDWCCGACGTWGQAADSHCLDCGAKPASPLTSAPMTKGPGRPGIEFDGGKMLPAPARNPGGAGRE